MTTLIQISALPLVHALGWTLLHLCWQGMLVALVLWCVLQVLDGRSSRVRYAAACLALGMMIALPLATFAHLASGEYSLRAVPNDPAAAIDLGMVMQVSAAEMSEPWPERIAAGLDHALPWIIVAWFTGVILFVVRLNVGLMVARRMRSIATTAVPAELQQTFDVIRRRLGVGRAVRLMHSALVQVPTVIGWLRPVVLVPASCLTGFSTLQIEAILAHELAHIRRHDYLVSVLQSVIETLLFYHPAVWWVSKQVRRERECCCDEMAVAVGGDRLAYARALSVLEERRAYAPEFVLGANGGVLTMRIKRLLGCKEDSAVSQMAAIMVLALIVIAAGSYVVTAARAEVSALRLAASVASPMELEAVTPLNTLIAEPKVHELKAMLLQPAAASSGVTGSRNNIAYTTWLNQDVLWIVTTEERAAFLKLANDEERDKFIEQFWARRDPPGSPAGGFKAEHYRRIAYSNEHFASDSPGWRSDRGRTYIMNGEPYSVDRHPSGAAYPYEVWHYRSADGRGLDATFEDTCKCGKYVLVSGNAVGGQGAGASTTPVAPATQTAPEPASSPNALKRRLTTAAFDMSCTYYGGVPYRGHDGTCKEDKSAVGHYSCRADDDTSLVQSQSSCEWKVQRLQEWQSNNQELTTSGPTAPAAPGGPVRISAGLASGMVLSKVDPVYPEIAKVAHVQGPVILHAIISKDGTIENVSVISGNGMLVNAARDAVSRWTYKPYLLNGQPTEVETSVIVDFNPAGSAQVRVMAGDATDGVKQVGGSVKSPIIIYQKEPEYTKEGRKAKVSGIVLVGMVVDEQGQPQNVHVVRGMGTGPDGKPDPKFKKAARKAADGMNENAVDAVKQYKFKPATENGKPVAVYLNVEVNFAIF
jgi:TonB family protein